MSKNKANFSQGSSANEQTGEPVWVEAPPDVAHSRRSYMGWKNPELGYNTRKEPRMGDELLRMAGNLQQGQYEHALWRRRGMPGVQDHPDGGSKGPPQGKIKAVPPARWPRPRVRAPWAG